jgi:hypothetical protein
MKHLCVIDVSGFDARAAGARAGEFSTRQMDLETARGRVDSKLAGGDVLGAGDDHHRRESIGARIVSNGIATFRSREIRR